MSTKKFNNTSDVINYVSSKEQKITQEDVFIFIADCQASTYNHNDIMWIIVNGSVPLSNNDVNEFFKHKYESFDDMYDSTDECNNEITESINQFFNI